MKFVKVVFDLVVAAAIFVLSTILWMIGRVLSLTLYVLSMVLGAASVLLGGIGILCLPEVNIRVIAVGYLHLPEEILCIVPQLLAAHIRLAAIVQLVHLNADKVHRIQHDISNGCGIHLLRMQLTDIVENILYRVCQG